MHRKIHSCFDRHRLVVTDERPFHQVIALAVGIEALFLAAAVGDHVFVVRPEHIGAGRADAPLKVPCSLPNRWPVYCASAVTSKSFIPGLISLRTRSMILSCMVAV